MVYSTHFSYGIIAKIQATDKGYTKMVLAVNIPFKQKYIAFNIWKDALLQDSSGQFKVDDCVGAVYHYKEHCCIRWTFSCE